MDNAYIPIRIHTKITIHLRGGRKYFNVIEKKAKTVCISLDVRIIINGTDNVGGWDGTDPGFSEFNHK